MPVFEVTTGRSDLCREILDDLPEWIGMPDANAGFIKEAADLPMLASQRGAQLAGIVSLKLHTDFAVELYVMGVKRQFHRHGIGRSLAEAAVDFAQARRAVYLTVKTLAPSHPDLNYAATRSLCAAIGFMPIEVFLALWNVAKPCLLMVKPLPA